MNIINVMNVRILGTSLLLGMGTAYAQDDHSHMQQNYHGEKTLDNTLPYVPPLTDDSHQAQHGGQIHQSTEVQTKWLREDKQDTWHTQLESRIGTDEHQLFVQLNTEKTESEKMAYDVKAMYGYAISEFWDTQVGLRHINQSEQQEDKNQTYFAVGLNGLAPYFFDSDIYLYIGKNKQYAMTAEFDRDFLFTQKWIVQPYIHSEIVFSDDSKYAKKSGLHHLSLGLETRYEITKSVAPFIEVGYKYEKGAKQTEWQDAEDSTRGWLYGAGIKFLF